VRRYAPRALRPLRAPNLRRATLVGVLAAVAALLTTAPAAFADAFSPESGGSPNADSIDTLYWITFILGIGVFLLVEGVLIYALVVFPMKRGGPEPIQTRGHQKLELGWTAGASVLVLLLIVVTFVFLPGIRTPPPSDMNGYRAAAGTLYASTDQPPLEGGERPLEIQVNGQQYLWRFDYPGPRGRLFSYHEMVVPTNTTITLAIASQDVAHSYWVPKLGGKMDAVPGHVNRTWFKATKPGIYEGQCAELCGENHADMRNRVRAVPPEEFRRWVTEQTVGIRASQQQLALSRRERGTNE
jgi:cytochrome c oxidase subunit 2